MAGSKQEDDAKACWGCSGWRLLASLSSNFPRATTTVPPTLDWKKKLAQNRKWARIFFLLMGTFLKNESLNLNFFCRCAPNVFFLLVSPLEISSHTHTHPHTHQKKIWVIIFARTYLEQRWCPDGTFKLNLQFKSRVVSYAQFLTKFGLNFAPPKKVGVEDSSELIVGIY